MYEDTIVNFAESGEHKALLVRRQFLAFLVGAAMAGAYIGFGDILMFTAGAHADAAWAHLIMGAVFSSALTIVVFAGSELFTGTAMYMPLAVLTRRAGLSDMLLVWCAAWIGNLIGAAILAGLFHMAGGGVLLGDGSQEFFSVVSAKMSASGLELLARGILCNWLVCLAIWMAGRTDNAAAKIMLIFWPITIFVAAGYEHSVANMFTFAMALMGDHPANITLGGAVHNLVWVTLGNLIGGSIFMGLGYWVQFQSSGHVSFAPAPAAIRAEVSAKRNQK
ncbi:MULTISPECIES: formate/nitrite transporter family protein [unclassified Rhizobium]|uniref:formate/nitrite transporter family protein n=1 Tax=unclassified Rhizobium TaxID=2613769 RepID=UPI00084BDE42|nr:MULTISPECIES: formate/nitrite transporter family protein [unclassified Rhizobium]OEC96098.1 nitrite transporter NirC [Rhizobium sp. YK2]QYA16309.1 formate/nitrite transporter family protein [Rhizobium sp. AB2/73]UEQ84852.1 formate/nitrite transporter family protein [Rhizobium sp. AB2/73]